jgi:hypothetical protein
MRKRALNRLTILLITSAVLLLILPAMKPKAPLRNILYAQNSKDQFLTGGTLAASNGIYDVFVKDLDGLGKGLYTIRTGAAHPVPFRNLLFGGESGLPGTSYTTIRSYTTGTDYVPLTFTPNSSFRVVQLDPFCVVTPLGPTGVLITYTLPGPPTTPDALEIQQIVNIHGTSLAGSSIEITTEIKNLGTNPVDIGVRYLWDLQLGKDDGPTLTPIRPTGSELTTEAAFPTPSFDSYLIQDNDFDDPTSPIYKEFGTVAGLRGLNRPPLRPGLLQYVAWPVAFLEAFDYTITPGRDIATFAAPLQGFAGGDAAVNYLFGPTSSSAIVIATGSTATITASLFAEPPGSRPPRPAAISQLYRTLPSSAHEVQGGAAPAVLVATGSSLPYSGSTFKGRILLSHDGNYNDQDDWGAFPVAIAILDAMGLNSKLVHAHFNNDLTFNDEVFEAEMRTSALGAQQRYGLSRSIFYDCQNATERTNAINSIRNEINRSTADNPLYMILAGPVDMAYQGIVGSDASKRPFVYCISHNFWNDGYGGGAIADHDKREVIPTGVNWIQIRDGNPKLAFPSGKGKSSTPEQWALVDWMKNSSWANLRWIYSRLVAEGRVDISDSTMAYFLLTGDENADLTKLDNLLDNRIRPQPLNPRATLRMEAENFVTLQNYTVVFGDSQLSQRLKVTGAQNATCRIRTKFNELYTVPSARYDVEVRYYDASGGQSSFQLKVNGSNAGAGWTANAESNTWRSRTLFGLIIRNGDDLELEVRTSGTERGELDYVGLTFRGVQ